MVKYQLKGDMHYVRGETAGRVLRRAGVMSNRLEREGKSVEAIQTYNTGDPDQPWVTILLVQEA